MMVPASEPLEEVRRVGIVAFEGRPEDLAQRAGREFQQRLLRARPELDVVRLDALEGRMDLDVVFLGSIEFTPPEEAGAESEIHGTLAVRMLVPSGDAAGWDVRWLGASTRSATQAGGGIEAHDLRLQVVGELAEDVTNDFRDRVVQRPKRDVPSGYVVLRTEGVDVHVPPDRAEPLDDR